ncbi:MAG: DoxX family protein [Acidobacteria bacterium]|nr:DoxX family protein [Acidobacteriota bacterium]MBI3280968.1 DoxX family protein [Acidobacteriota bacterium]
MDDSIAHPPVHTPVLEAAAWKTVLSVSAGVVLAALFLASGIWKITDPLGWAERVVQLRMPALLAVPAAMVLGIAETFAGLMLLVPRFRRWGAWLIGALLTLFMIYVGVHYGELRGEECSCFPWVKRAVGPAFFLGDALMLAAAVAAGWWARPSQGKRSAIIILAAVSVFALTTYGMVQVRQSGVRAPDQITVDGQPYSLRFGRHFLYFFDPECSHCYQAAKEMAGLRWKDVKRVAIPTAQPQFAKPFLENTGFQAGVSNDVEILRKHFSFTAGPFGVVIDNGRQREAIRNFDDDEPEKSLRRLGLVE